MIAVTGANGNLGKLTIQHLLRKIAPSSIIAIARDPETIKDLHAQGVVVRQADYNDYQSLKEAFQQAEKLLQISTIGVDIATARRQEQQVVDAAAENGVKHIVYTSMLQAKPDAIFEGTATHYNTEELIKQTKIPYTIFRNSMYMEFVPELIGDALQTGEIRYPSGNGKISFVSRADIAESLSTVLTESSAHENKSYEIAGNKAWAFHELAALLSTEKGIPVRHSDISVANYRAALVSHELPIPVVDLFVSMANAIKAGEFSHTADTLEHLLDREIVSLNGYVKNM